MANEISRRRVLTWAGALCALTLPGSLISCSGRTYNPTPGSREVFSLGVASGDPWPDSVVLWTRLAPDPLNGGGMAAKPVPVEWQIAADDRMAKIVRTGTAMATPELGHSVHVEVQGLEPARWYWYRFRAGSQTSPVGRTRTAPAPNAPLDRLRFAFASCQNYEHGYYTALRHMAEEDLELVVHLGDYIYETGTSYVHPRLHNSGRLQTLEDYRNRYAQYKSDPDLQAAHAAFPWAVTWDDHEVSGNWAGGADDGGRTSAEFERLCTAAFQAYYEHLPLRLSALPNGASMRLYRQLAFGDLATIFLLDTRQYRTAQSCGDKWQEDCAKALNSAATMLGSDQEQWLFDNLRRSSTRWNVLAQQVPMMQRVRVRRGRRMLNMDKWDGYVDARSRLLGFLRSRRASNPVVISGDVHRNLVADLKVDFENPDSMTVASEFVTTSISSDGDGSDSKKRTWRLLRDNPHIKFFNGQRGYVRCELTRERWKSDYRIMPYVTRPGAPIETRASFVVENGQPGVKEA